MKNLVRLFILAAVLWPLAGIAFSCSEEADCSMVGRPLVQCVIYTINPTNDLVENDTLDSLTVTAYGTDSVIINNQKQVHDILLPLRYSTDSTKLIFHYSRTRTDTVVIFHTNTPYFLSMDCGYQMEQSITSVRHTSNLLDSAYLLYKDADIYGRENLQLFY